MSIFSLKILIVEDNLAFALQLEILLEKLEYFVCGRVANSIDALKKIYSEKPDLILMDIDIQGSMTGVEIGKKISNLNIPILYITSHGDEETYALARESNMIGYLVKPVNKISLRSGIELAISKAYSLKAGEQKNTKLKVEDSIVTKHSFFFKKRDTIYKVLTRDIAFIKSDDNYTRITNIQGETFTARMTLSKLEQMLPRDIFARVHRQYIVQVDKIEALDTSSNTIQIGKENIPVSRNRRKELESLINFLK